VKFDVVVGNPPYMNGLHLSFLEKAYEISSKYVVFIEPASWLISEKNYKNNTKEKRLKKLIEKNIQQIDILNPNPYFKGVNLATPAAIIVLNKEKHDYSFLSHDFMREKTYTYNHIDEISKWGNDPEYLSLKKKIIAYTKLNGSLLDHINDKGKFYLNFALIRGHVAYDDKNMFSIPDFFTFVPKDLTIQHEMNKAFGIGFDTEQECVNALEYVKTKFSRMCLSILKNNLHINMGELNLVPWLDFSQNWNDEKLYKYFKLTKDEISFIETNIPKYYE